MGDPAVDLDVVDSAVKVLNERAADDSRVALPMRVSVRVFERRL